MPEMAGSVLLRRYIGRRFASLRLRAGLTQDQAASALQRGRATLGRIEDGDERVRFRDVDVRQMLDLYGAGSEDADLLLALTSEIRNSRGKSWWHDYTCSALPQWFGLYVSLEDGARLIRAYEPELVPGLLQTREYAQVVVRTPTGLPGETDPGERVGVRMRRQEVLARPRAPELSVVLNEAVLRRPVGGARVMAGQLRHLVRMSESSTVLVRVLPWAAGTNGGLVAGTGFTMFSFPTDPRTGGPIEPDLAYVETLTGAMYLNRPDEVAAYTAVWDDLEAKALDRAASISMILEAAEAMTRD